MATFGERLRQLRKNVGKLQIEVAQEIAEQFPDRIRMSQTTLSALESRETAPRGKVLDVLAAYYHVPTSYFYAADACYDKVERARLYLESLQDRTFQSTSEPSQDEDYFDT